MQWSQHKHAEYWLVFVSFIEAIFFPIPPDVMLIPMAMSRPQKAMKYAINTTLASVLGGIIGYGIGFYAFDLVKDMLIEWNLQNHYNTAENWFKTWGVLVVFLAGFSPIPFKVFTLCAGVLKMAFVPFAIAAGVSRLARFVLVAKLSAWGGEKYADKIQKYIEIIGWATVILAVLGYGIYQFFH